MKRMLFLAAMLVVMLSTTMAQVDDVTLVVSGEGTTKDEATTKALSSAIEQAFGVFVSANTEILNDELVRDEIATISSGNIKKYTELGITSSSDGKIIVSLQAVVSVNKLISYAKGHGSSCEFAGSTFAANRKLVDLNKRNTILAFQNLYKQIDAIGRDLYSCEIIVGNPTYEGDVPVELKYYSTETASSLVRLISSTLLALAIPEQEAKRLREQNFPTYSYEIARCETDYTSPLFDAAVDNINRPDGQYSYEKYYKPKMLTFYAPLDNLKIEGKQYLIYDNLGNIYNLEKKGYYADGLKNLNFGTPFLFEKLKLDMIDIQNVYKLHLGRYIEIVNNGWGVSPAKVETVGSVSIPEAYFGKWQTSKQSKKYVPSLIISIKGKIHIPVERLNNITSIFVKQSEQ